jgi:MoaA/NifB/PqqE/SkfB family radical SAM enzyme
VLLGVALTQHCNLRCPHCIRDDVATVRALEPSHVLGMAEQARELFGDVTMSFTGGEPTLHPQWADITAGLAERSVPYRFVSNGWHMRRLMPAIDRSPPAYVRLSLSGASAATHDAERGRDSFRRVMLAVALLTSRRIPTALSIVIDRRDRHEVRTAADLAEALGCVRLHYILPQPVPASIARATDLPPHEWAGVQREVRSIAAEAGRQTVIQLDYGAPPLPGEEETVCDTMALRRLYVDAHGRVSLCCQLSDYGFAQTDVVGDLREESLSDIWTRYVERMAELRARTAPGQFDGPLAAFPCLRCAHALGKLQWLDASPSAEWSTAATKES